MPSARTYLVTNAVTLDVSNTIVSRIFQLLRIIRVKFDMIRNPRTFPQVLCVIVVRFVGEIFFISQSVEFNLCAFR